MLPRWHIIYGALFTLLLGVLASGTRWEYLLLVFAASVLIDIDHYICFVWNTKRFSLKRAFEYHRLQHFALLKHERHGKKPRGDFHFFHTVEFHMLIALIGVFWTPAFYLFIGLVFHSLLDIFAILSAKKLHRREYFFTNWIAKKF